MPNGAYRPKNSQFDYARMMHNFVPNPLIDSDFIYLARNQIILPEKPFSAKDDTLVSYYGFYSDGRFITGRVSLKDISEAMPLESSFNTADYAGYYISKDDLIHFEYFRHSSDGIGVYAQFNGKVAPENLVVWYVDAGGLIKYDTLFLSGYPLIHE